MLSDESQFILDNARSLAKRLKSELITFEHLLFAIFNIEYVKEFFNQENIDVRKLRKDLLACIFEYQVKNFDEHRIRPVKSFRRFIISLIEDSNKKIELPDLLFGIYHQSNSYASFFLRRANINEELLAKFKNDFIERQKLVDETIGLIIRKNKISGKNTEQKSEKSASQEAPKQTLPSELFCQDLVEMAKNNKLNDNLIGREKELNRLLEILHRRRKSNPIIVGKSGVGKSALIEGFAQAIANKNSNFPEYLTEYKILSLNLGLLLAGTKYRGDIEERVTSLLKELSEKKNIYLFIDDIHQIIGAGATSDSSIDIASLLKPYIQRNQIKIIGAITDSEYRKIFEKQDDLNRLFQRLDLNEPDEKTTLQILQGTISKYAHFHEVIYQHEALVSAIELSNRYLHEKALPDKAIDLLDEAGAINRLKNKTEISSNDIEELVATLARVPSKNIKRDELEALFNLEAELKKQVFGQDEAIKSLVSALKLSRAGLRQKDKTIGSFLFTGPTGVGKTELCKQLSEQLNLNLIRFDMSEYMEKHSVSKLIGTSPGYVGYEQEGLLVQKILKNPYSILLLDEIEKADAEIMNILLQIMDNGRFTDNNGRIIDCRNILLVLTSNVGAFEMDKNPIGFINQNAMKDEFLENAIKRFFTPEFRNRLDKIINFKALTQENILHVVDKFIAEVEEVLQSKNIDFTIDEETKLWLAKNGYEPKMGARPMSRIIERYLKEDIADALLMKNNLAKISFTIQDDKPLLNIEYLQDKLTEEAL